MSHGNDMWANVQALGDGLIEKAAAMCEAAWNFISEKIDDMMNGLIGKLSEMVGGAVSNVKSGAGRMTDSLKASVTPSASPKLSKDVSPDKGQSKGREVSDAGGQSKPDMSNLLKDSGCGDLAKFQCESMTGGESINSGCMSAAMARQVGTMAAAEQEMGMPGPGGSR